METQLQDLGFGLRMMRRRYLFTAAAVLMLAVGIGANTAIFSLVNAILLRELPYRDAEHLVWVWATRTDRDKAFYSIPNFLDTRDRNQSFEQLAAFANWGASRSPVDPLQRPPIPPPLRTAGSVQATFTRCESSGRRA
jgi:putative ABC transport system permease protein